MSVDRETAKRQSASEESSEKKEEEQSKVAMAERDEKDFETKQVMGNVKRRESANLTMFYGTSEQQGTDQKLKAIQDGTVCQPVTKAHSYLSVQNGIGSGDGVTDGVNQKGSVTDEWRVYDENFIGHQARQAKIGPNFQVTSHILTDSLRTLDFSCLGNHTDRSKEVWNPDKISQSDLGKYIKHQYFNQRWNHAYLSLLY